MVYSYRSQQGEGNSLVFRHVSGFYHGMKLVIVLLTLVLISATASAEEKKLDGPTLRDFLSGITLTSTETGRVIDQVFQESGVTFTVDIETRAQSQGFWRIEDDKYCSQWPPSEHWSCYVVFGNDQGVVFVSSNGTRYQMELPPAD
jgi:hypothetical protein